MFEVMRLVPVASCLAVVLAASSALAEDPRISVSAAVEPSAAGPGEQVRLDLTIDVPDGWHLWSLDPGPGPLPLVIESKSNGVRFEGGWYGDMPVNKFDRGFQRELAQYGHGQVKLSRGLTIAKDTAAGDTPLQFLVKGQICTDAQCLSQNEKVEVKLVVAGEPVGVSALAFTGAELSMRTKGEATIAAVTTPAPASGQTSLKDAKSQGFFWFIFWAFGFGLAALATPCVFPAIPLTVSFFSKYSEESFGRGARLAGVYAATMVAAFTLAGVVVSILFGVTGIQDFAAHPAFNVVLGVVLVFFSLNLLGLFEIRTPAFLMQGVNTLEGKFGRAAGLGGGAKQSKKSDYLIVMIAALTATTVFFTCTVAFVGLVLVSAAKGEWFWPSIGMLSFASAFALPFFLLAMFPQAAKRLQGKAGSWLGATRVTLGFLELAAATKFLSNADLVWKWEILTRQAVLVFWIPLFVLCAFYLLGKLRLGHESMERPDGGTSIMQMLAATGMFALSLTLAVGLFNGKPFGGWLDGWLPPVVYPSASGMTASTSAEDSDGASFKWIHNLEKGREAAKKADTLVFVNYTGYTCTNCRYMEGGMFPRPEIASLLHKMTLVELYTDGGEAEHTEAREDQVERFGTAALPLYSVETADGQVLGHFPSSTNDPDEFRRFLEAAMAKAPATRAAPVVAKTTDADAIDLILATQRLSDGKAHAALRSGRWNLVNFWATWCGPCKTELRDFMVRLGADLAAQGGHFAVVAVEEDDTVADALSFMQTLKVPESSALRVTSDYDETHIDNRFKFDGSLPFTALISPQGEIVWRHGSAVTEEELRAVLVEHTGLASLTTD